MATLLNTNYRFDELNWKRKQVQLFDLFYFVSGILSKTFFKLNLMTRIVAVSQKKQSFSCLMKIEEEYLSVINYFTHRVH